MRKHRLHEPDHHKRFKDVAKRTLKDKAKQILHGALPEFLKHGYDRTSMDKVAKSAGVSKQTLYSYYNDKNGLFTALIENIASEKFQILWSKPLEGEPETVLKEIAYRLLDNVGNKNHLSFSRLILAESDKRPDLSQLFLSTVAKPSIKILTRYFQEQEGFNFSDPEATAMIFIGSLIHYVINQELLHGKEIMPMEQERYVNTLIDLVLAKKTFDS
ncbi:transcriptional regulator [Xenococcus sp. PCC 7305]|uniref:TetR/AcrR family transcriptional regulator n=1 Tax=Xenococcus sp. PCC 7305 TaxID=102125 RepID=UPI0002AC37BE|nr:TetR/AcrR family transcriptional regulator [Xenococcus sp. PCC 7305]ELS04652.1 transcriptional regulator [Xenococcus sp. PCC 7305]